MKKIALVAIASTTLLSACVITVPAVDQPTPQPFVELPEEGPSQIIEPQSPVSTPAVSVATPTQNADVGTCDMSQALINIGQPVSSINTSGNTRIVKPNTAITMDARSDRLTVYVDESNHIITAQCI